MGKYVHDFIWWFDIFKIKTSRIQPLQEKKSSQFWDWFSCRLAKLYFYQWNVSGNLDCQALWSISIYYFETMKRLKRELIVFIRYKQERTVFSDFLNIGSLHFPYFQSFFGFYILRFDFYLSQKYHPISLLNNYLQIRSFRFVIHR